MDITYSIFPKFFKHLDVPGLAAMVRDVGLDTTNLVIRKGYWVPGDDLASEVPAFVEALRAEGLEVRFATAGFSAREIVEEPDKVRALADSGITDFRMGYFRGFKDIPDPPGALAEARRELEAMVPVLREIGIRAVYQIHHGTLVPSPSGIYHLVKGLPPEQIGVMLDPGNQGFEGFEKWGRSARMLGDHLCAIGVKDTGLVRDPARASEPDKGWTRTWATCDEGVTNWHELLAALKDIDFRGTFSWQPFYHESEPEKLQAALEREVAYIRRVQAEVEAAADA